VLHTGAIGNLAQCRAVKAMRSEGRASGRKDPTSRIGTLLRLVLCHGAPRSQACLR